MARVKFDSQNTELEVASGTTILEAARQAGVVIESPCNGVGTCGKCKVILDALSKANVVVKGKHHLTQKEEQEGYVLSCQAEITGDVAVRTLSHNNKSLKILDHGKSFKVELDTFIRKEYVENLSKTLITGGSETLGMEDGNTESENFGLVVDIGTTTLVTSLVDVTTGNELGSVSALNPQAIHAQDVLSRIKFASEEKGLQVMYRDLIKEINRMIDELTETHHVDPKRIYEVVFSGNTCMLHLAAGVNPYSLGKYPYTPELVGGIHLKAAEHQIHMSDLGVIYLPPVISAYVGADITSGILASELHEKQGTTLFVDIGTNGEMAVGVNGKLSATSTAAGPAFEGMNITCGMRAGNGAVELFNIEEDGSVSLRTIGNGEATGICGSGLLDIVGELVAHNVINRNGKFVDPDSPGLLPELRKRLVTLEDKPVFLVTDEVYLTQKDIRQVQLAKGAVRAGIEFLLESSGILASQVDHVQIAGSFGYHLREKSLINIGLLPPEFSGKVEFLGNTSKSGGQAFLVNKGCRAKMKHVVNQVQVIELANYKDFDRVFVKCLGF